MPAVATAAPAGAVEDVADEGRRREHRPGRDLADGDGVDELRLGEPAEADHEIGAQEREEDVAAAEEHRADLEEDPEERRQRDRGGGAPDGDRGRERQQGGKGAAPSGGEDGRQPDGEEDDELVHA